MTHNPAKYVLQKGAKQWSPLLDKVMTHNPAKYVLKKEQHNGVHS